MPPRTAKPRRPTLRAPARPASAAALPLIAAELAARIVLARAALAEPRARSSPAAVSLMIHRLGYVQIDSIAAVERAHDTILRTRLAGYSGEHLRLAAERDRSIFEHWTHDASFVPVTWLPYWHQRFRRDQRRLRNNAWWKSRTGSRGPHLLRTVLQTVRRSGPTRSRDLLRTDEPRRAAKDDAGWWGWSPEKAALEALWRSGRVAVARRDGFQKAYDLFERVHAEIAHPPASAAQHLHWACSEALARLGIATPREIAGFFGDLDAADVERWARTADGRRLCHRVLRARADGGEPEPALAAPDALCAPPDVTAGVRLLSPFDPVVRDRQRLERIWGFVYRFEAFVPEVKRVDGYYTLPVLDGARFIGRCALRTERRASRLTVERWRSEQGRATMPRAVEAALERFASELGLARLVIGRSERTSRARVGA